MRIDVRSKCTPLQKLQLGMIEMLMGAVPGPIAVMTYRRDFWGKPMTDCFDEAMRKTTAWTKPEVELFAAMTSRSNTCNFCYESHKAVTILGFDDEMVQASLEDWRTAPVSNRVRVALGFVEKLTKTPDDISDEDIAELELAGVDTIAAAELVYIVFGFNVINRMANAFDFDLVNESVVSRTARFLYHMGYSTGSIPG